MALSFPLSIEALIQLACLPKMTAGRIHSLYNDLKDDGK
jgi:hypothetical protein